MFGTRWLVAVGVVCSTAGFAQDEVSLFDSPGESAVEEDASAPMLEPILLSDPGAEPAGESFDDTQLFEESPVEGEGVDETRGEGTELTWTAPSGQSFTLTTTEPGPKTLLGFADGVELRVEAWLEFVAADLNTVTLGGLTPGATYYRYVDSHTSKTTVVADAAGRIQVALDGTASHRLWVQTTPSTVLLNSSTVTQDYADLGTWDATNRIFTLTSDVADTIEIIEDDFVLDCAEHDVTPSGGDVSHGIYVGQRTNVTVRNCHVYGFATAQIDVWESQNVTLENNQGWQDPGAATSGWGVWAGDSSNLALSGNVMGNLLRTGGYPDLDADGNWLGCDGSDPDVGRFWEAYLINGTSLYSDGDVGACVRWSGIRADGTSGEMHGFTAWQSEGNGIQLRAGGDLEVYDSLVADVSSHGVNIYDAGTRIRLERTVVTRTDSHGVLVREDGQEAIIVDSDISENLYHGINTLGGDVTITGTSSHDNGSQGIRVQNGSVTITGGSVADNPSEGIRVDNGDVTISGTEIYGNAFGVRPWQGSTTIDNVVIHDNTWEGIKVMGGTAEISDVETSGNYSGIKVEAGDVTITRATVDDSTNHGLHVQSGTVTLTDVEVSGSAIQGFSVSGGTVSIAGGSSHHNTINGLVVRGGKVTVAGTQLHDNSGGGIWQIGGSLTVEAGTEVWGNANHGAYSGTDPSISFTARYAEFHDNGNQGLSLNGVTAMLEGVDVYGNYNNGVWGSSSDVTVVGGTFHGNGLSGIAQSHGELSVTDADTWDNDHRGVYAQDALATVSGLTSFADGTGITFVRPVSDPDADPGEDARSTISGCTITDPGQGVIDRFGVEILYGPALVEDCHVTDAKYRVQHMYRLYDADGTTLRRVEGGMNYFDAAGNPTGCSHGPTGTNVRLDYADDITIEDGIFGCANNNGMHAATNSARNHRVTIRRSMFAGAGNGIRSRGDDWLLEDVVLLGNDTDGWSQEAGSRATLRSTACDLGEPAPTLAYWNGQEGLDFNATEDVTLECVRIADNGGEGIEFSNGTLWASQVVIDGHNSGHGIWLSNSPSSSLSDVRIDHSAGYGLGVLRSNGTTVTGSSFSDNGWEGVRIEDSDAVEVSSSQALRNGDSGFRVDVQPDSTGLDFTGNTATENGYAGLLLQGADNPAAGAIVDNDIVGNCEGSPPYGLPPCADVVVQAGAFWWSQNDIGTLGLHGSTVNAWDLDLAPDNTFDDTSVVFVQGHEFIDDPALDGSQLIVIGKNAVVRGLSLTQLVLVGADNAGVRDVSLDDGYGIVVAGSEAVTLDHVVVQGAWPYGVQVYSSPGLTLADSDVSWNNAYDPLHDDAPGGGLICVASQDMVITGTHFEGNRQYGVNIDEGCDYFLVEESELVENTDRNWSQSYPIAVRSSFGVVSDNSLYRNGAPTQEYPYWISYSYGNSTDEGTGNLWEGNTWLDNNAGILIDTTAGPGDAPTVVHGNQFLETGYLGVEVHDAPGGVQITGNLFQHTALAVGLIASGGLVEIRDNTLLLGEPRLGNPDWSPTGLTVVDVEGGLEFTGNVVHPGQSERVTTAVYVLGDVAPSTFLDNYLYATYPVAIDPGGQPHRWSTDAPDGSGGTNVLGGPKKGGNAYLDTAGSGFSQTCENADGDDFCDLPYTLLSDPENIDDWPLALDQATMVCHTVPLPDGPALDLLLPPSAVSAHLAHGDVEGPCDPPAPAP